MTQTSTDRVAAFRTRMREAGLAEVRGLWLPRDLHAKIKAMTPEQIENDGRVLDKAHSSPRVTLDYFSRDVKYGFSIKFGFANSLCIDTAAQSYARAASISLSNLPR